MAERHHRSSPEATIDLGSDAKLDSPPSAAGSAGSVAMKRKRAAADVAEQWRGQATANA